MTSKRDLSIPIFAVIAEGALALIFLIWAQFRILPKSPHTLLYQIELGILAIIPLILLNYLLFGPPTKNISAFDKCRYFRDEVIKPLADGMNAKTALVVALAAGIGEELFFRGVLQNEVGIILASLAFGLMHFGTKVIQLPILSMIYFAVGLYFGWIYLISASLITVTITHVLYDYLALLHLRYFYTPESNNTPPPIF